MIRINANRLLTIVEAAERLGVCRRTVHARIASGELRVVRFGSRIVRIDPEDLDRYVASHKTSGPPR